MNQGGGRRPRHGDFAQVPDGGGRQVSMPGLVNTPLPRAHDPDAGLRRRAMTSRPGSTTIFSRQSRPS